MSKKKLEKIKVRLDANRKELRDVLVSGRRVDMNNRLIDSDMRNPRDTSDAGTLWALRTAQLVTENSSLFHRDSVGRADVGETALLATQLKYWLSEYFGDYYPKVDCRAWLTVDGTLPVGAIEYSMKRILKHGQMKAVAAYGNDAPVITVGATEDTYRNVEYQGKVVHTLAQLEHAAYGGFPLETESLNALSIAAEQNFEQRWHSGDSDYGTLGFYNAVGLTGIILYTAVTGTWATATHDQIIGDVRALMYGIRNATNVSLLYPDTLVVPNNRIQYLGVRRTNTDITVRQALQEEYPGIRIFESSLANTLDAAGTGPRLLAFASDRAATRFGEPRFLEMMPPQQMGTAFESIGRQNIAGAFLPQPLSLGHMDGI